MGDVLKDDKPKFRRDDSPAPKSNIHEKKMEASPHSDDGKDISS